MSLSRKVPSNGQIGRFQRLGTGTPTRPILMGVHIEYIEHLLGIVPSTLNPLYIGVVKWVQLDRHIFQCESHGLQLSSTHPGAPASGT